MSLSIEEIRERLMREFYEDEEMIKKLSDEEILKIWRSLQKKVNRRSDIWDWNAKRIDIVDVKSGLSKNVLYEIRGIVTRVLRPSEYLGCPIHRTKLREVNGEYYCHRCGEPVSPARFKIYKFIVSDDTGEVLVVSFPMFSDELGEYEKNLTEGDYVAVRGSPDGLSTNTIFNARAFKVLLKAKKRNGMNVQSVKVEEESEVKVKDEVEKNAQKLDMDEEEQMMFDIIRYKMSSLLRRKDYLTFGQIKFIARDVDIERFIEKFFIEVEEEGKVVYKLKPEYKEILEAEGLL